MRRHFFGSAAVLAGALLALPSLGFAQAPKAAPAKAAAAAPAAKATVANLSTQGVVKSIDATSLVITRTGKKPAEMTFALNTTSQKQGEIKVGTHVAVRYTSEGKTLVAAAITAQPAAPAKK